MPPADPPTPCESGSCAATEIANLRPSGRAYTAMRRLGWSTEFTLHEPPDIDVCHVTRYTSE